MPVVFYLCLHNEIHLPLFVYLQLVARPFSLFGFRVSLRGQISDTTVYTRTCRSFIVHQYTAFQQSIFKNTAELYFRFLPEKEKSQCGETQTISLLANSFLSEACSVTSYFLTMCVFTKGNFTLPFRSVIKRCLVRFIFLILIVIEMNIISSTFSQQNDTGIK